MKLGLKQLAEEEDQDSILRELDMQSAQSHSQQNSVAEASDENDVFVQGLIAQLIE